MDINATGTTRLLEAIRRICRKDKVRFYQASSSELFGMSPAPQNESTPFLPCSPYGVAKLASYWMTKTYRDGYGMFASNGILFNHESARRGETFVTKKVVRGAVKIHLGKQDRLVLGNLNAKRDWGHSKDYMKAVLKILEHHEPDDFVVATGEHYSIEYFVERVFDRLGMNWRAYVDYDSKYTRPKEVPELCGDPAKIKRVLDWEPEIKIEELIEKMITSVMEEEADERNPVWRNGSSNH
jgi:GDPmannose 4,6-dehydratase